MLGPPRYQGTSANSPKAMRWLVDSLPQRDIVRQAKEPKESTYHQMQYFSTTAGVSSRFSYIRSITSTIPLDSSAEGKPCTGRTRSASPKIRLKASPIL